MVQFKYVITVGPKKQGLWRPLLRIRIFTKGEGNILNIDPSYKFPRFRTPMTSAPGNNCSDRSKIEKLPPAPVDFYWSEDARKFDPIFYECCTRNPYLSLAGIDDVFKNKYEFRAYLTWRPGQADYSDVVAWLQENLLDPCIQEFKRRWDEALESAPMDEVSFTSSHLELPLKTNETVRNEKERNRTRKVRL